MGTKLDRPSDVSFFTLTLTLSLEGEGMGEDQIPLEKHNNTEVGALS
jgi:hypothetical protein